MASPHCTLQSSFLSATILFPLPGSYWVFTAYIITRAIPLADMNHDHMSSTWCACIVSCELNKGRPSRVLALFFWERDVPDGRRFGFWLDGSLAQALRGCDPQSLAESTAPTICCFPGHWWAGLGWVEQHPACCNSIREIMMPNKPKKQRSSLMSKWV